MSASIVPNIASRLGSLLRMLGSPVDGEALAACRAIGRTLQGAGCDLHDLADTVEHPPTPMVIYRDQSAPRPQWRDDAYTRRPCSSIEWPPERKREARETLQRGLRRGLLTTWEEGFAYSIMPALYDLCGRRLSDKQAVIVERLLAKIGGSL